MPALVRRLLIWAAADGLVLQASSHGPSEHHQKSVQIDYKSRQLKELPSSTTTTTGGSVEARKGTPLEAHGVIGLLSLASSTFLIAITQREQVAEIFGKPVYVVTDVALVPLSSQSDANTAIAASIASKSRRRSNEAATTNADSDSNTDSDEDSVSNADLSDDPDASQSQTDPHDAEPVTPLGEIDGDSNHGSTRPEQTRTASNTSIARDVIARRGQYGRFASQWFSKQGWGVGKSGSSPASSASSKKDMPVDAKEVASPTAATVNAELPTKETAQVVDGTREKERAVSENSVADAVPKILRSTKMILTSRSYFFSYEFDLTRRLALLNGTAKTPARESLDPLYFWNRRLATPFFESRLDAFVMPIIQGFVGQRAFVVKRTKPDDSSSAHVVAADLGQQSTGELEQAVNEAKESMADSSGDGQSYLLTLISRRSVKRSGLRYLRRGIDDDGNCANSAETEQILSAPDWSPKRRILSFVQVRGSIPLYFSQSPYSFKPIPILHHPASKNEAALKKHFHDLKWRYGGVQIAALVDKHGTEAAIGQAYDKTIHSLTESHQLEDVEFEWFDFHAECRGMKFENVARLVEKLEKTLESHGETVISDNQVEKTQSGIIRTNCMDCLDRTNVAQSAFGQFMLQKDLAREGYSIDLLHDESTTWFNALWADNGDAISRQYASTAALKGDFTRTRRRDYRGALNDFSLTLTRYYNNMVNDYFSQAVIDVLLGNTSWKVFEDFESTVMRADPGISIEKIRETAIDTCARQVIQDESEDLIHGWTMLTPLHDNTLRTLPFEEAVVLLTDAALYCCRFDWTTEKLASFEKADLRFISKIRYGTYITSTLSERQMKEDLNAGVVIVYQPGKESIIRTNTRSLQNYVVAENSGGANTDTAAAAASSSENRIDGGTGILSWLAPSSPPTSRTIAIKVIPAAATTAEDQESSSAGPGRSRVESPMDMAQTVAEEIQRAMTGTAPKASGEVGTGTGTGKNGLVEHEPIISLSEAKKRTGYFEQLGHSIKKLVWA